MSIKWMERVFGLPAAGMTARDRLVLLSLADKANDDGVCWPSQARIARDAGTTPPTVSRSIGRLAGRGFLVASARSLGKQRTGREYRLTFTARGPEPQRPGSGGRPLKGAGDPSAGLRTDGLSDGQVDGLSDGQVDDLSNGQVRVVDRASDDLSDGQVAFKEEPSVEPSENPLSLPTETRRAVAAGPLREQGGERGLGPGAGTATAPTERPAQLPLWGSATEHVEGVLAGLEARDREEVAAVLRAWLGQAHGARAVATWARQAASWPPGRLASKGCPRAYVEACLGRVARQVADEAAREAAAQAREEVRGREAARDAAERAEEEAQRAREKVRLREAFLALGRAEQEAVVAEAEAQMHPSLRSVVEGAGPLGQGILGRNVMNVMRRRDGA